VGLDLLLVRILEINYAVFEAAHGSAPDIAGKNLANPIAITLSGASSKIYRRK